MNLELLRPFDKEAAQRGEEICSFTGDTFKRVPSEDKTCEVEE